MTPLTPSLIISHLAEILVAPVVAPMVTPDVVPTLSAMFHAKAENLTASRENFAASQKNLTASQKCFTVWHDIRVLPLVRLPSVNLALIFKQLSARCKRCHLFFLKTLCRFAENVLSLHRK